MDTEIKSRDLRPNWALLGIIRFMLAVVVLFSHMPAFFDYSPLWRIREFGSFAAVVAFLGISGFSIAHSITQNPDGYAMRRINRIAPCYYAAVILGFIPPVLGVFLGLWPVGRMGEFQGWWQMVSVLTCLSGVLAPNWDGNGPAWTLGCEVVLYALAPLFLRLPRRILWSILAFSFCLFMVAKLKSDTMVIGQFGTLFIAWAWLLGWLLYFERDSELVRMIAIALPCVALCWFPVFGGAMAAATVTLTGIALGRSERIVLPSQLRKTGLWLGDWSYPLYICHWPLSLIVSALLPGIRPEFSVALVIAGTLAVLLFVDIPLRRRGRRNHVAPPMVPAPAPNRVTA